ncbi:TVP38/TMEM64 family protein [Thalassobacillus sp. CUG 92003]|uniref:TVP38/TMEM64 family protein n=1 Tax=Thalassobacillus sp. CUG 92003 TaxID=2736641 RepID=UPI0015E6D968|nr:VTT domain-containing protein [Thalassobacillus sp. CUG 92003]
MNRTRIMRAAAFLILFIGIVWLIRSRLDITPQEIRSFVLSFGLWGPLLFIGVYAIGPLVVFPTSVLSLAAAYAYGIWPGMPYILLGASGAAITGYVMGRFFGDSVLQFQHFKWADTIYHRISERGFLYVFILRLIPIVSFDLLSYSAGTTRVRLPAFLAATFFGMIPGTFAYSFLGSSLSSGNWNLMIIAISLFIALLLVGFLMRNKVKQWLNL